MVAEHTLRYGFGTHCWLSSSLRKQPQIFKTFTEPHNANFSGMYISAQQTAAIIKLLVEAVPARFESLRNPKTQIEIQLLVDVGELCELLLADRI